jgi:hypothetical protein
MSSTYNLHMKKIYIDKINKRLVSRSLLGAYIIASLIFIIFLTTTRISRNLITYGVSIGKNDVVNSIFLKLESDPCYPIKVSQAERTYTLTNTDCPTSTAN